MHLYSFLKWNCHHSRRIFYMLIDVKLKKKVEVNITNEKNYKQTLEITNVVFEIWNSFCLNFEHYDLLSCRMYHRFWFSICHVIEGERTCFLFSQSAFMSYFIASLALSWTKKVLNFHSSFPGDRFIFFLLFFILWNYVFCMISCPSTLKFRYFNAIFSLLSFLKDLFTHQNEIFYVFFNFSIPFSSKGYCVI